MNATFRSTKTNNNFTKPMLNIQLLGIGCMRYKALKANLEEAMRRFRMHIDIAEVNEVNELIRYGIKSTPALVFGEKVVVENRVASISELEVLLQEYEAGFKNGVTAPVIHVPVDFSGASSNAFHFAQEIAPYFDADVKVVHVYHPDLIPAYPFGSPSMRDMQEFKEDVLENFIENNLLSENKKNKKVIQKTVIPGFASDEIIRLSKEESPELIVMGTTGDSGVIKSLLGSVSIHVSKKAEAPVLLIPKNTVFKGFNNILYASNFDQNDEAIFRRVLDIGKMFNANFHIVHVDNSDEPADDQQAVAYFKRMFETQAPDSSVKFQTVKDKNVAEGINRYAEENDIDLVVMLPRQRSFWQNIQHKSVTQRVAMISSKPILVVHFDL